MSRRREVSSIVVLTAPLDGAPARLFARHFVGTIHAREVLVMLRYVHRRLGGRPVFLIWDRLNVHRSRVVRGFLDAHPDWFRVTWLPGYAPELNPEEQCNGVVKGESPNAQPDSVGALRRLARRGFQRLGRRPEILRSFFTHAGLSLT